MEGPRVAIAIAEWASCAIGAIGVRSELFSELLLLSDGILDSLLLSSDIILVLLLLSGNELLVLSLLSLPNTGSEGGISGRVPSC